jgi:small subunit ribosomal protein S16
MAIRLRLAMHGRRHRKVFHLVAIDSQLRREAKPAEVLGVYDPHSTEGDARVIRWSVNRIRYWLDVGATPSKSALKMLELASLPFFFRSCPECHRLTYELPGRNC